MSVRVGCEKHPDRKPYGANSYCYGCYLDTLLARGYRCQYHPERPARTKSSRLCTTCYNASRASQRGVTFTSGRPNHNRPWKPYRLGPGERKRLYDAQGGSCAICATAEATQIDHHHATGTVRALLCRACNLGLGMFQDAPVLLGRAAAYLTARTPMEATA